MKVLSSQSRLLFAAVGLLLTACEKNHEVAFVDPFPAQAADLVEFPARHRGMYTAADPNVSLCIGHSAMWRQELQTQNWSLHQLDSLGYRLRADSTYLANHTLHYLHRVGADSVRDSWLWTDTVFSIGLQGGHLRRFQGRYYLSYIEGAQTDTTEKWQVQRLEISGRHLRWQQLGTDTLRLEALVPGTVRYHRRNGISYFRLAPVSAAEARRIGRYAGLWETDGEYDRRH
ncbi:MAG: hypothetical protein M3Y54_08730 [Bacteroidota bacterium]|nr:hypothetical protein [Bacteroidota bacterium]